MNKTAEEIADEILRAAHVHFPSSSNNDTCAKCGENFRYHFALGETLKDRIMNAILADRKERDERAIEVLKYAMPILERFAHNYHKIAVLNAKTGEHHCGKEALRQASALLADRKERDEIELIEHAKSKPLFTEAEYETFRAEFIEHMDKFFKRKTQ